MSHPPHTTLSIVIPAFNERRRLGRTLEQIRRFAETHTNVREILVVDDGSTDGTAERVRELTAGSPPARVLINRVNRGKGYSVRRGVLAAEADAVLVTDADLSTPIEEIAKLLACLARGDDVAIGSRDAAATTRTWPRRVMEWAFRTTRQRLLLADIHDTQCGFKCFRREAAREIFSRVTVDRFAFDCEVLVIARRLGFRIREVSVIWRADPDSRLRPIRDSLAMLADLLRIRRRCRPTTTTPATG